MTTQLEDAPKSATEAINGDENVLKGVRNTLHWDKKALKGNKDKLKRDG